MDLPLRRCPDCGGRVTVYEETQDHLVVDLPEVEPVVRKYRHERGYCPRCKKTVRAPRALDEPPYGHLGLRTLALVCEWKTRLGIPYGKIARLLESFHLPVARGGLPALTRRVSEWLKPAYEGLCRTLRRSQVVGADETSWPVNGHNGWMWTFTTGPVTVYLAEPTRSGKIAIAVLGQDWAGILISDLYAGYLAAAVVHQYCWAHLLREAKEIAALAEPVAVRFHGQLTYIYREAQIVSEAAPLLAPHVMEQEIDRIDSMLSNLRKGASQNREVERLKDRIARHQDSLLTFLRHPGVAPTNNESERKIRPAVVVRKISGGSRSWPGARAHAAIMSCLQSLRHLKASFLDLLRKSACLPSQRMPIESVAPT